MGAQKILQEIKNLQQWVDLYDNVQKLVRITEEFIALRDRRKTNHSGGY